MTRKDVYKLIDGERKYQEKWDKLHEAAGSSRRDSNERVECWIVWMDTYLDKAKKAAANSIDKKEALRDIRKVAALAVACMEYNDTPAREGIRND